jgi:hypothetical protein
MLGLTSSIVMIDVIVSFATISDVQMSVTLCTMPQLLHCANFGTTIPSSLMMENTTK